MEIFRKNVSAPILIIAGVAIISFSLMLWAAFGESAIMDELAHIPAGYGYVHNLDYRLNPEHPPLVKALSALPLLFLNPVFPTNNPAWTTAINGQWDMGTSFLYNSGNNPDLIIRIVRIAPILLTLLLIILIYIWSAELLGAWWGLLPSIFFAFSPTVLAHGHYVTTDVGAALGIFIAAYFFIKFIFSPSAKHLVKAGLFFGIAQVMKFSAVLLIPYFIIVIIFYFAYTVTRDWQETQSGARLRRFLIRAWEYIKSVFVIFAVGYIAVVYPAYFILNFNQPIQKQTADTEFILASFANGPTPPGHLCKPVRCLADFDIWMAKNYFTRPFSEYMLGVLMVLQRSSGGNTSYFMGEVSNGGSPLYFPTVYALKEPLPVLIAVFFGMFLVLAAMVKKFGSGFSSPVRSSREVSSSVFATVKRTLIHVMGTITYSASNGIKYFFRNYLGDNFTEFSMFVFVALYWAYSIKSPLNIGIRHLLPTFPFIYILTVSAWKKWIFSSFSYETNFSFERVALFFREHLKFLARLVILLVLTVWLVVETISSAPYFLSYFNEFGSLPAATHAAQAGGTYGGYRYVTDSNYDWGQDLLRLRDFVQQKGIDRIAVDYFGGGNPKYYLGDKEIDWQSSKGNPFKARTNADLTQNYAEKSPNESAIKWLAVSVNTLQSAIEPLAAGQTRNPGDGYEWLVKLRPYEQKFGEVPSPDYRIGTSIFVYKL